MTMITKPICVSILPRPQINVSFGDVAIGTAKHEEYEGPYTVTPRVSAFALATENKLMSSDLTVEAIPYAEVSNIKGGKTATIGGVENG